MKHEIGDRYTNACQYSVEFDDLGSREKNIGEAVRRAIKDGANLRRTDLHGADLSDVNLVGANLVGANLSGANLSGAKIQALRAFAGLYQYQIWAYVLEDGTPCVRMGCMYKTIAEWDAVTIRKSNLNEFPDDGSTNSERRARAFEFARQEAIQMASEVTA